MREDFEPQLQAHVVRDDGGRVRAIRHSQEPWVSEEGSLRATAISYLREMASTYEVSGTELTNLHVPATHMDPRQRGVEYRLAEETQYFDSTTFGFDQTYLNTPVWGAGFRVMVKQGPNRVIQSVSTVREGIEAVLPSEEVISRYRRIFTATEVTRLHRQAGQEPSEAEEDAGTTLVSEVTGYRRAEEEGRRRAVVRLIRGRFWVYQYDEAARLLDGDDRPIPHPRAAVGETPAAQPLRPSAPIPPVREQIQDGNYYLVAEITFEMPAADRGRLTWQALVELETGSILYLRALTGDVNGYVFLQDPPTKTGDTSLNSASSNATLNPYRDNELLRNLDAPSGNVQSLTGTYGHLMDVEGEPIQPPTQPTGSDFLYNVRTNDFAAVSAYFQVDRLFRAIADLGFTISGPTGYFKHTKFPIPIDHRCLSGNEINAHCVGDGMGGIGHVGYGLMDTTDTVNPLGRACDPRVTWHELGGHGILYEYVNSPNFGFAHSAGDSLSGIFFDPESKLWGVDGTPLGKPGDLRFTYVPWHPTLDRRFDRSVSAGWAWGGTHDDQGYGSEEILATTLFQVYRSIGGDSSNLGERRFASRMMMYLILRAVQNLTPATNPAYARDFAATLMDVDKLNWTSEGIFGGAYNKVIRWSFEKQGEYQNPLFTHGRPKDVKKAGQPPDQDVYIDDGRAGEYGYQAIHWHNTIWNRRAADGLTGHQEPALGQTNYAYVKIKNRGTQQANNVIVRGFHTKPGAGLLWPADFDAFTTAQINVGSIAGNNTEEKLVGPFQWTPNINAYGHDCMLMIVSAGGDPSNIDNFTAGEVIQAWRLVPNDNNVGQRNVQPVPGGGGTEGLLEGLNGMSLWVGNPNPRPALMQLKVELPRMLASSGWRLSFEGLEDNSFKLKSGERREVVMRLHAGKGFTADVIEGSADRDINVMVYADDILMGGMTYRLDPSLTRPYNAVKPAKPDCTGPAKELLDCLGLPGQDVKSLQVKEIIVGFRLRDDDC